MSDQTEKIKSVVLRMYSGLCSYKDKLRIRPLSTVRSLTFEVVPHEYDFRKLIGKQGSIYKAMGTIMKFAGQKIWITEHPPGPLQVAIEIERTGDGREDRQVPIDPKYDKEKMMELVRDTCDLVFSDFQLTRDDTASKSIIQILAKEEVDPDLALAMNKIFWAYGKATGRIIQLEFSNVHNPTASAAA